jgi:hypothetical protein
MGPDDIAGPRSETRTPMPAGDQPRTFGGQSHLMQLQKYFFTISLNLMIAKAQVAFLEIG